MFMRKSSTVKQDIISTRHGQTRMSEVCPHSSSYLKVRFWRFSRLSDSQDSLEKNSFPSMEKSFKLKLKSFHELLSATMHLLKCGQFTSQMLTILTPCWSNLIQSSENYFLLFIHLFIIFIIQNFTETPEVNILSGTIERFHWLDWPTKDIYILVYLCILLHGYWQVEKAQSLFRLIFSSDWLSFLANQRAWKFLSVNELVF